MAEDTKFPDIQNSEYYMEIPARFDFMADFYDSNMRDWFQRCIEDYPTFIKYHKAIRPIEMELICQSQEPFINWFKKWFGQFKEKSKFPEPISVEEF